MDEQMARAQFPTWAAAPLRELEEKPRRGRKTVKINTEPIKAFAMRGFKKYGIAILAIIGLAVYGWTVAKITENRVANTVEEEVTAKLRGEFQAYLDNLADMQKEKDAPQILTDEESRNAAIEALADDLDNHVAGLRMDRKVTKEGAETYCWVDLARLMSGYHGSTMLEVLNETGPNGVKQIEAYTEGHAVRNEDTEIALKVATAYITGQWPDGFTPELQYAEINADGSVTARDKWKTDSTTTFWRIK